jgi:vitamin-K-epoxide reductase (warfarin-sensitive)
MHAAVTAPSEQIAVADAPSSKKNGVWFSLIAVLALAGMAVSAVSLQRHYATSASGFCDFGERFNCDVVNRSEYSEIIGIPVAGIGIVGYGVLLALSTFFRGRVETPIRLLSAAFAGLAFALYLTYIEGHVLETWCILCLSSLVLIVAITILAAVIKVRAGSGS